MVQKKKVYFNEYNVVMNNTTYLPLVSGMLMANSLQSDIVKEHYDFAPFLFRIDEPANILAQYDEPAVAAFSILMWNAELSLYIAKKVKEKYPNCVIVFGGAHVPHHPEDFFKDFPFIDVAVRAEGEEPFREILEHLALGKSLKKVANVSCRDADGSFHHNEEERPFARDLDAYPSPYIEGLYDYIFEENPDLKFQAIIETNRGCPFHCTFCYWGKGGLSRKYRYHGIERVQTEIQWMADHEIQYVFNADSNFGMHRRDAEIADILVKSKKETGYPEKFRTCYGKNTDEKIFQIGQLFHQHKLEKGITISYQSTSDLVQKNIKRDNIKLSSANELQRRFNESDIPVYTELILGLPGESKKSWRDGIEQVLSSGLRNQLFIYICQVYPNTDLGDPEYQKEFGIETKKIELTEIHGTIRNEKWIGEFEEIVIRTNDMTTKEWQDSLTLSWFTMVLHSLKLGFFVLAYFSKRLELGYTDFISYLAEGHFDQNKAPMIAAQLREFEAKAIRISQGEGRGCLLPKYGPIYWDEEEACFLRLSEDFDQFYRELELLAIDFLNEKKVKYSKQELDDVLHYQDLRVPRLVKPAQRSVILNHNVAEYFDKMFSENAVELVPDEKILYENQDDFGGDPERFARETILWGRKSGLMLSDIKLEEAKHKKVV